MVSKYQEIYPPEMNRFVEVTDKTYTKNQMLLMESQILIVLHFRITAPTVLEFYELFIHNAGLGQMANEVRKKTDTVV